ncbi:hypothetical protein I5M27_06675 [Adhaeribacter sp. BT258]|uniref:AsmA-like C-terminal domain-containing protein n=1 Tax=Adhaeribacter terrigena TaxID=2793070 RepID=A0ABS1BZU6_9BACT|nr:hypothetical protein [Adhaeribacter terrigena]MBK0402662.1 hypothetical protein [Adhaeribacter terrigena]
MGNDNKNTSGLPDMAFAILNQLGSMNAEFSFDFENMELQMPGKNTSEPGNKFLLNGTLRIKTKGNKNPQ